MTDIRQSPYFVSYVTPPATQNVVPVSFLRDMVSYNVAIPTRSIDLNYQVGSAQTYSFPFTIKNITVNTPITASISPGQYFDVNTSSLNLAPLEQKTVMFSINTSSLNAAGGISQSLSKIEISLTNQEITSQSLNSTITPLVTQSSLPTTIRIS